MEEEPVVIAVEEPLGSEDRQFLGTGVALAAISLCLVVAACTPPRSLPTDVVAVAVSVVTTAWWAKCANEPRRRAWFRRWETSVWAGGAVAVVGALLMFATGLAALAPLLLALLVGCGASVAAIVRYRRHRSDSRVTFLGMAVLLVVLCGLGPPLGWTGDQLKLMTVEARYRAEAQDLLAQVDDGSARTWSAVRVDTPILAVDDEGNVVVAFVWSLGFLRSGVDGIVYTPSEQRNLPDDLGAGRARDCTTLRGEWRRCVVHP